MSFVPKCLDLVSLLHGSTARVLSSFCTLDCFHRHRSGLEFWGHMTSAEVGLVPSMVGYGEGCPLPSRLGSLGSVISSPQWGPKTIGGFNQIEAGEALPSQIFLTLKFVVCIALRIIEIVAT